MLSEEDLIINKVAQDKLTFEDGVEWFKKFDSADKRSKLNWLRICLEQTHPNQELINQSIDKIPLKSTMTPIVICKLIHINSRRQKFAICLTMRLKRDLLHVSLLASKIKNGGMDSIVMKPHPSVSHNDLARNGSLYPVVLAIQIKM